MLLPVDYLSPALAQKMARNGHLSALSQGVGASDAPAAFPTPETESPSNAAAEADENKKSAISPSVLYSSYALAEMTRESDRGAGAGRAGLRFRSRTISSTPNPRRRCS